MKLPSSLPVNPQLLVHFENFQSRAGLWRLRVKVWVRRLVWRFVIDGADVAKRTVDIVGSGAALLLLSPLFAVLAFMVRLDGGAAIFTQKRVGRFGQEFKMFKFRSMRPDAEKHLAALLAENQHAQGITFKIRKDPRITKIGHWLRRLSLDELPQFYNVFTGDMSLVGPRPPVPREVAQYSLADRRRLAVKPGITCLWQIGGRAEIDFPGQVRLDVDYIENQSLQKDLGILVRTIPAVLFGPGAY